MKSIYYPKKDDIKNFNDTLNINWTSARSSSGVNIKSINQNGIAFSIRNLTNNNSIRLNTMNSSGVGQDNVFALDGNTGGLQGDSGNTITIVGTQATIGGTSVPIITTQPLTASNNNEIASTAFVKTNLLNYALLNSNNTFTGTNNRFTSNGSNLPVSLQNTDVPTYGGGLFIASANGQYNANTLLGDTVLLSLGNAG